MSFVNNDYSQIKDASGGYNAFGGATSPTGTQGNYQIFDGMDSADVEKYEQEAFMSFGTMSAGQMAANDCAKEQTALAAKQHNTHVSMSDLLNKA